MLSGKALSASSLSTNESLELGAIYTLFFGDGDGVDVNEDSENESVSYFSTTGYNFISDTNLTGTY